jgi:hypothetical protein
VRSVLVAAAAACALIAGVAFGATALPWSVGGSSGGRATSTNYAVEFTAGQPAAGVSGSASADLGAGFWYGAGGGSCDIVNTDAAPLDNGPLAGGNDVTIVRGDTLGDSCDDDDDNDGVVDTAEVVFPVAGCAAATSVLQPLDMDTDGDHLTDGWECANGSDPADGGSKFLGVPAGDSDGDRIGDIWEQRGYGATPGTMDADGDGCADLVEIASVEGNETISDVDRIIVARRAVGVWGPEPNQDYVLDIDKNGSVNDVDRIFVARAALLPDWLPKSCS